MTWWRSGNALDVDYTIKRWRFWLFGRALLRGNLGQVVHIRVYLRQQAA